MLSVPPGEAPRLLVDWLSVELGARPAWATQVVLREAQKPRLLPDLLQLAQVASAGESVQDRWWREVPFK